MLDTSRLISRRPVVVLRFVLTQVKIWFSPLVGKPYYNSADSRKMCELTMNYAADFDELPCPVPSIISMPAFEVQEALLFADLGVNSVGSILRLGLHHQIQSTNQAEPLVVDNEQYLVMYGTDVPNWHLVKVHVSSPMSAPRLVRFERDEQQDSDHNKLVELDLCCPWTVELANTLGDNTVFRVMPTWEVGELGASYVGKQQRLRK